MKSCLSTLPFHPFEHQNRAWRRLSSQDQAPRSTIVTTGTGSGKTKCFLFPLLDYCLRALQQGQQGIKALILYPMTPWPRTRSGALPASSDIPPNCRRLAFASAITPGATTWPIWVPAPTAAPRPWVRTDLSFNDLPQYDDRSRVCTSFFALIAYEDVRSGTPFPLVPTQVQLWIRELRRPVLRGVRQVRL